MPELPDVVVYVEHLGARFAQQPILALRIKSPFVVRTYDPPALAAVGRRIAGAFRIGKRIVLELDPELYLVFHLMISGRFHLRKKNAPLGKLGLLAFDFEEESLLLTEASSRKRASLHVLARREEALALHRGGVEPLEVSEEQFRDALLRENRTLKRALTDPRLVSGIGNAYSDEILFRAKMSPLKRTFDLKPEEHARLFEAVQGELLTWTERLRREAAGSFPEKVTAFRPEMNVHGRYRQPCRVCGSKVQRIVYAENESNYCATCQTGGKLLADRALSRLLRGDFPKTLEELEEMRAKS